MWVYQESAEKSLAIPAQVESSASAPQKPQTMEPVPEKSSRPVVDLPRRAERPIGMRGKKLSRDCVALAASYLFGALLSGVVLGLSRSGELNALSVYLDNWSGLFTLDEPKAVWTLFGAEYLTVAGGATILLMLGLSAIGPVMIYLFAMLFGMGMGVIELRLFLESGWQSALFGLFITGIPTAAAVTCLCLFGASALGVSGRLQRAAFGRKNLAAGSGARRLLGQYLVLNVLFVPICGVSTALVCLAHQVGNRLAG